MGKGNYITQVPLTVPGCRLWLDAMDADTITQSSTVSSWRDKSGSGHNASNATGATQPTYNASGLNGKPAIVYTLNKTLGNANLPVLQQPFTLFYVIQDSNTVSASGAILLQQGSNFLSRINTPAESNRFSSFIKVGGGLEPGSRVSTTPVQGTPYILSVKYNGTTLTGTMHNNGNSISQTRTPADAGSLGYNISNSSTSDFATSEYLAYAVATSTDDTTRIVRYLANKWGIPIV